jgi:hypothetical protein
MREVDLGNTIAELKLMHSSVVSLHVHGLTASHGAPYDAIYEHTTIDKVDITGVVDEFYMFKRLEYKSVIIHPTAVIHSVILDYMPEYKAITEEDLLQTPVLVNLLTHKLRQQQPMAFNVELDLDLEHLNKRVALLEKRFQSEVAHHVSTYLDGSELIHLLRKKHRAEKASKRRKVGGKRRTLKKKKKRSQYCNT